MKNRTVVKYYLRPDNGAIQAHVFESTTSYKLVTRGEIVTAITNAPRATDVEIAEKAYTAYREAAIARQENALLGKR